MKSVDDNLGGQPPMFKSWRGWYVFVIGFLVLQIILFYLFTLKYS